jgi:hypothetical protein
MGAGGGVLGGHEDSVVSDIVVVVVCIFVGVGWYGGQMFEKREKHSR